MTEFKLSHLSRRAKRMIMVVADFLLLPLALWLAFCLRHGDIFIPSWSQSWLFVAVIFIAIPIFVRMGLYRAIVHYMELRAFFVVAKAVSLMVIVWGLLLLMIDPHGVPRSAIIIFWLMALLMVGGSRVWARWLLASRKPLAGGVKHQVAIYGAGSAGMQLLAALKHSGELAPVAFLDDDPELAGQVVAGVEVYALDDLDGLIKAMDISQVLIALPSASQRKRREIVDRLEPYPVSVRVLPGVTELAQGHVSISDIRDVSIEDLLGRDAVAPNAELIGRNIRGKCVMVTGAGGSIGSELCRQALRNHPSTLVLFEQNEFSLYAIEKELKRMVKCSGDAVTIIPLLGSVMHQGRVLHVCEALRVQTIYHAAAYKHVPLVECNPIEAVQNNIFGTWRTANAALAAGVETFVLISTDKAVRPTNVMGATKRMAELGLQALAEERGETLFSMVRFGNVLGSSGSVVPLFREQIKAGGPVTVTHPEITRYFMTIPEASQLVIQAGAMGQHGDVFVLDMGEPVKIVDLAKKMVRLSGLTVMDAENPSGDIEITFSGLRPGEKLYEELLIGDVVAGTEHPLIMRATEKKLELEEYKQLLHGLNEASQNYDLVKVRELLLQGVAGYQPQCDIQDALFCQTEARGEEASIIELKGDATL